VRDDLPTKEEILADDRVRDQALEAIRQRTQGAIRDFKKSIKGMPGVDYIAPVEVDKAFAPLLHIEATPAALRKIGGLADVIRLAWGVNEQEAMGEAFDGITRQNIVRDVQGWDGTGVNVAVWEGDYPESWFDLQSVPLVPVGSGCMGMWGFERECHCPSPKGIGLPHAREVAGIIRSSGLTFGGTASGANLLIANYSTAVLGDCRLMPGAPNDWISAAWWATGKGASILNSSEAHKYNRAQETSQSLIEMYQDYLVTQPPYPTFVTGTANGGNWLKVGSANRNGIVVGAADDAGSTSRSAATMPWFSQGMNLIPGWELPHILAPGVGVNTAQHSPPCTPPNPPDPCDDTNVPKGGAVGTSYAVPIISGIVASVHHQNPGLKWWPEVMVPALMVSVESEANVHGVWPLNLHDAVDDWDGAGLVNANATVHLLKPSHYNTGGGSYKLRGFNAHSLSPSTHPAGQLFPEVYHARAGDQETLLVASILFSQPQQCEPPPCSSAPYPNHSLCIYDAQTGNIEACSQHPASNYQFVSVDNNSPNAKDYDIKLFMINWNGVPFGTTHGIAWDTLGD
ncbi:MAG: S8 family serine peptidase, partial [Proteobacteria bacterium]|nr:S8 family serine peptidase [Pseudomonadota bacterium]